MRALLAIVALLSMLASADSQQRRTPAPAPPPAAEPAPEPPPPTYEPELLRLAEVLGGLSYLSTLCNQPDTESWSQRMDQLMEAEGATASRKERLAGAYNRGYLGFQPAHRVCSESSRMSIDSLVDKGQKITTEISRRYGG